MNYLSLFSGIGAPESALKNIGINYNLVGFSEVDKYAVKSYCEIHGVDESLNLGDITKIDLDKLPKDIDLITGGFPCQDISVAGKQKGISPSLTTMGGGNTQPKILDFPCIAASRGRYNSDGTTSQKLEINNTGNTNTITSVQKDNYVLVKEATKKGYKKAYDGDSINLEQPNSKTRRGRVGKQIANTLTTSCNQGGLEKKQRKDIKELDKYCEYCGLKLERKRFNGRLEDFTAFKNRKFCNKECMRKSFLKIGYTNANWSNAHASARNINKLILKKDRCEICGGTKNLDIHHIDGEWKDNNLDNLMCLCRSCHTKIERNKTNFRIRKLTPKEAWRLMGFGDDQFEKAAKVCSNSQLYKQAGNSIVVNVLESIFENLRYIFEL